jgi:hypothetical protein
MNDIHFKDVLNLQMDITGRWPLGEIRLFVLPRGVNKFFKTLTKLASSSQFSLTKSKNNWRNNWPNTWKLSVRGKKIARLTSGFVFLLANPEFYSHLASWRVVIRTPALGEIRLYYHWRQPRPPDPFSLISFQLLAPLVVGILFCRPTPSPARWSVILSF